MTKKIVFLTIIVFLILTSTIWSTCPEDKNDRGECDTMYVEPWPDDIPLQGDPPYFLRVPIYITCDVVNDLDSVTGFTIPLCYSVSSPAKAGYCSLTSYWNTVSVNPYDPAVDRSIFRDLPDNDNPVVYNRMFSMARDFSGREWDYRELYLDGTSYFRLAMVTLSSDDQQWWEGSRVLLATMTFKLEGNMEICIDTCLWPPSTRLALGTRNDEGSGVSKIPRSGTGTDVYGGCFNTSEVEEIKSSEGNRPSGFHLLQNYPNPFNPTTSFEFSLAQSSHVKIDIFNILGQRVTTVVDEEMKPGVYLAEWDGRDEEGSSVSSGIYFYRMQAGDFSETKRMVLLK